MGKITDANELTQLRANLTASQERVASLEDDLAINKNAYGVWYKRCKVAHDALRPFANCWVEEINEIRGTALLADSLFKNAAAAIAEEDNDERKAN